MPALPADRLSTATRVLVAAGATALIGVMAAGSALSRDTNPWTWDYNGPGSVEQLPSMLVPWQLPGLAAGLGAGALFATGHPKLGAAAALGALAVTGAGFGVWLRGKSTPD